MGMVLITAPAAAINTFPSTAVRAGLTDRCLLWAIVSRSRAELRELISICRFNTSSIAVVSAPVTEALSSAPTSGSTRSRKKLEQGFHTKPPIHTLLAVRNHKKAFVLTLTGAALPRMLHARAPL